MPKVTVTYIKTGKTRAMHTRYADVLVKAKVVQPYDTRMLQADTGQGYRTKQLTLNPHSKEEEETDESAE